MPSRLRNLCLRTLKGGLELVLALCGWPWWPWASRLLDRLDLALRGGGR